MIDEELLKKVTDQLKKQHLTIATAESCSGGLLAHTLTNISGSSDYFEGGIVSYSNRAKVELLQVPEDILVKHGAVSEQAAEAMAIGIKNQLKVDVGISTTGIAGPTGGTKDKPVGLVYISLAAENKTQTKKNIFTGNRLSNKENTCNAALKMILDNIS